MKRFWAQADIQAGEDGFTIRLDDRPMRLPGGQTLRIDHRPLAEAIAAEWGAGAVGADISPQHLPLTQLAATAYFRIAPAPADTVAAIAAYARSDLLCYRAGEPAELARRQQEAWQPWLDWVAHRYDAMLTVTSGIGFVEQSPYALAALARAVAAHDIHGLATLGILVPVFGSLVLGLAVTEGALAADDAFRISVLDEVFQEEHWGHDHDAAAHRARSAEEIEMAARYFRLTRSAG